MAATYAATAAPLDEAKAKSVLRQVEFHFSDSNLPRDRFLREMAEQSDDGVKIHLSLSPSALVSLALICSFSRMKSHLGLDAAVKPETLPGMILCSWSLRCFGVPRCSVSQKMFVDFSIGDDSGYLRFEDAKAAEKTHVSAVLADEGGLVVKDHSVTVEALTVSVKSPYLYNKGVPRAESSHTLWGLGKSPYLDLTIGTRYGALNRNTRTTEAAKKDICMSSLDTI